MPDHILVILLFAGASLVVLGNAAMIVNAFLAGIGWGLCYLFVPLLGFFATVIFRWEQVKIAFCILMFGVVLMIVALYAAWEKPESGIKTAFDRYSAYQGVYTEEQRVRRLFDDLVTVMHNDPIYRPFVKAPVSRPLKERGKDTAAERAPETFIEAVRAGRADLVSKWIGRGAGVNEFTEAGTTPLMEAAAYGYSEVVKVLLAAGADPDAADAEHKTALDFAQENMRTNIVELLRKKAGAGV